MSSLLEQASLVITPNAYKEGKLYGLKGTDLDVVRATTATRVNAEGFIEEVPYNLLSYSEQFDDAAWTKNNSTITANSTTSPSGFLNADTLTDNSTLSIHRLRFGVSLISSTTYTLSVFAKKNTLSFFQLALINTIDSATSSRVFDLENGVLGEELSSIPLLNSNIVNLGNDWYRCSITVSLPSNPNQFQITLATLANGNLTIANQVNYLGDGNGSIYLWGAQLVQGTQPKEYLRTETRLNIPRLDYTNGSCPSILVEPQRTNLLLRSEEFDNASWIKTNTTVTANAIISPDGNNSADKLVEDTATANHLITQATGGSGVQTYAISVFAKSFSGDRYLQIWVGNTINAAAWIRLDLDNGTITQDNGIAGTGYSIASFSIQDFGNGWYKCVLVANKLNTTGTNTIQFRLSQISTGAESNSYLGNGTSGLYLWGAQLEAGSNATSYIPTVASAVTRNADVISKTGIADLIGQSEGTLFVEGYLNNFSTSASRFFITLFNDSTLERISLTITSTNNINLFIFDGNASSLNSDTVSLGKVKIALTFEDFNFKLFVNGTFAGAITNRNVPDNINKINLGCSSNGTLQIDDFINSAILWKTQLTDQECINLTTL